MRAGVVEREDLLALADEDELVDPELGLDRPALGDRAVVVDLGRLQRDPLRAGAAERVAADHVAEDVDDVAADVGAGRQDQEADDGQPRPPPADAGSSPAWPEAQQERDDVADERDDHQRGVERRALARLAVRVGVVGVAREGRGEHRQDADRRAPRRPATGMARTSKTMTRNRIPIGASVSTACSGWPSQRPFSRSRTAGILWKSRVQRCGGRGRRAASSRRAWASIIRVSKRASTSTSCARVLPPPESTRRHRAPRIAQAGRSRSADPVYRASGRMSRLSAACSIT